MMELNKQIIDLDFEFHDMVRVFPWRSERLAVGLWNHQTGYGSRSLAFVINYLELGSDNSFVWVVANPY